MSLIDTVDPPAQADADHDLNDLPRPAVRVADCVRRPNNPRPSNLEVKGLAASIEEVGQVEDGTVVTAAAYLGQFPEHRDQIGDARYVVAFGCRRHAAAELHNHEQWFARLDDTVAPRLRQVGLIENIQRKALPPVQEGGDLQALANHVGGMREAARRLGVTHSYVIQRVSLTRLTPQLQVLVDSGEVTVTEGRNLARHEPARQWAMYQAGPPFTVNESKQKTPDPGVVPGDVSTYTRTDLDTDTSDEAEVVSATAPPVAHEPATSPPTAFSHPEPEGGVPDHDRTLDRSPTAVLDPFATTAPAQTEDAATRSDVPAEPAHSATSGEDAAVSLPPPAELATQITTEYTPSQLDELVTLLTRS